MALKYAGYETSFNLLFLIIHQNMCEIQTSPNPVVLVLRIA